MDKKNDAIRNALAQIEKNFGQGTIMKLGERSKVKVETIPTGSISLDRALGGGVPKGRIIEIYGPESSGKTTLALHVIAETQKNGGAAAFIDAEHALDPEYARRIGVNTEELLISQPDNGEQALEIVETLTRSGGIDVIVIDSVAALTPKAEIEGMMGDSHMGLQARLMSQALRKLTSIISKTGTTVIFLNQLRMKIGVMFGNPETTTGGNALKFYSSVRMDIRAIDKINGTTDDGKEIMGRRVRVKVIKNKIAPPFKQAEFDIMFNEGISSAGDLLDTAVERKIVNKSGAFYTYKTTKIGQGRENAKIFLNQNEKMMREIKSSLTVSEVKTVEPKEKAKI
jgi:recombination protein RecA